MTEQLSLIDIELLYNIKGLNIFIPYMHLCFYKFFLPCYILYDINVHILIYHSYFFNFPLSINFPIYLYMHLSYASCVYVGFWFFNN